MRVFQSSNFIGATLVGKLTLINRCKAYKSKFNVKYCNIVLNDIDVLYQWMTYSIFIQSKISQYVIFHQGQGSNIMSQDNYTLDGFIERVNIFTKKIL